MKISEEAVHALTMDIDKAFKEHLGVVGTIKGYPEIELSNVEKLNDNLVTVDAVMTVKLVYEINKTKE